MERESLTSSRGLLFELGHERRIDMSAFVKGAMSVEEELEFFVGAEFELISARPIEPELSASAERVLARRYLRKDDAGQPLESASELFGRVAANIALAEERFFGASPAGRSRVEKAFYEVMARMEFLPNSPTLMNAGSDLQQLSACFVLPVDDSMESIFDAIRDTALIHKSGGGTGFSFSRLRPAGSRVRSTNGVSSGPVSFMKVFDSATESVKQGGTRRGANMGILRVDHPDILDFIDCKRDMTSITNFNISVALTDDFLKALEADSEYDLIAPHTKEIVGRLSARRVYEKIIDSAWSNGDPGIIFIDRINHANPTPRIGAMEATNPCGEQPLLPYESCNLGSINLSKVIDTERGAIDWDKLKRVVRIGVRFLDNVIEMNRYPLEKIDEMTKNNRKIGLGVMGYADALIKLQIAYNSEEALEFADEVMSFIDRTSKEASAVLAASRSAFPNFDGSMLNGAEGKPMRNATTTTIAPTGTISIIAGCSSGIEPLFALSFVRNVMDNDKLFETHPLFERAAREEGVYSPELLERVAMNGHIENEDSISPEMKRIFVTAHSISPEWHIKTQAAFQRHVDNAVSKTVNFPRSATREDVRAVYDLARAGNVKGVTIYRDGSRENQVLSTGSSAVAEPGKDDRSSGGVSRSKIYVRPRPKALYGTTRKFITGCGPIYVTINYDQDGAPFELFTHIGKAGGCAASQTESIGRLVSMALRSGLDSERIEKQLRGISCHMPAWDKGDKVTSCADAIAKAIRCGLLMKERNGADLAGQSDDTAPASLGSARNASAGLASSLGPSGICPDCSSALEFSEGCLKCLACGYSKC